MGLKIAFIVGKSSDTYPYKYTSRKAPEWLRKGVKMHNIFDMVNDDNTVPSDVATAAYIAHTYPNSVVNVINGMEIMDVTVQDLNYYDLVIVIYDPIEVFYCERRKTCPHISKHLEMITRRTRAFVLPPPDFHGYIIHKHRYYADLKRANIPVVPFFHIDFKKVTRASLTKRVEQTGWKGIIIKPSYAGYSMGIKVFRNFSRTQKDTIDKYLKHMKTMGYPDATVQEFIPSFGDNYEIRTYWIDGKYSHAVGTLTEAVNSNNSGLPITDITVPVSEGGSIPDDLIKRLRVVGRKALKALPYYKEFGHQPLVRIDFGCCLPGGDSCHESYFINEVETMAANLLADHTDVPVVPLFGKAIHKFALKVVNKNLSNRHFYRPPSPAKKRSMIACKEG